MRGPTHSADQEFFIEWKDYGREEDRWIKRKFIDPDFVTEYLKVNELYDFNWSGER